MSYTAVVNLDKRQVDLYKTGDKFFYNLLDDAVIMEATYNVTGDSILISGDKRRFTYYYDPLVLSEQEFKNTKLRKDRFTLGEQTYMTFSWKFPFVKRTLSTIYTAESGAISYSEHKPIDIKLPLSQTVVVSHLKDK